MAAAPRARAPASAARRATPGRSTSTLSTEPLSPFAPGQFNMLYVFGVGEVPISISGDPAEPEPLVHTIRAVGTVSQALASLKRGRSRRRARALRQRLAGRRRRRARTWSSSPAASASRRCARRSTGCSRERERYGRVVAALRRAQPRRHPLSPASSKRWRRRLDIEVEVTVDHADADWRGNVGVVTTLIPRAPLRPAQRRRAGLRPGDHDALRRRGAAATRGVRRRAHLSSRWSAT